MTITTMTEVKSLEPRRHMYNRGCGDGLYLKVESIRRGGNKFFTGEFKRKYVYIGKCGSAPNEYDLKSAKNEWFKIKQWCIETNLHPKEYKNRNKASVTYTLRNAIDGFLENIAPSIKETTLKEYCYKLNRTVLSHIDEDTKLNDLEWDNGGRIKIKNVLDKIANGRKYELRERCRKLLNQTFTYAIDEGQMRRGQNPAEKERREVGHRIIHHKSISWSSIPELIKSINLNKCNADMNTVLCTKLMLLTALRSGAATRLRWYMIQHVVISGDNKLQGIDCIVIPGNTTGLKRRKGTSDHIPHYIPITKEIKLLLKESKEFNGENDYIFPALWSKKYPHLNPEAPNKFLSNIGYKDTLVAHGCRSIFMTTSREMLKFPHRIIDLQLGHIPGNKVDAAYDRSQMLEERKDLLEKFTALLVQAGLEL